MAVNIKKWGQTYMQFLGTAVSLFARNASRSKHFTNVLAINVYVYIVKHYPSSYFVLLL